MSRRKAREVLVEWPKLVRSADGEVGVEQSEGDWSAGQGLEEGECCSLEGAGWAEGEDEFPQLGRTALDVGHWWRGRRELGGQGGVLLKGRLSHPCVTRSA